MEDFLEKVPVFLNIASLVISSLTVVATVVVKLTPSKADDEALGKFAASFYKIMDWLPYFGTDPRMKKLEEAYKALKSKDDTSAGA